jgi:hypothetical protein
VKELSLQVRKHVEWGKFTTGGARAAFLPPLMVPAWERRLSHQQTINFKLILIFGNVWVFSLLLASFWTASFIIQVRNKKTILKKKKKTIKMENKK